MPSIIMRGVTAQDSPYDSLFPTTVIAGHANDLEGNKLSLTIDGSILIGEIRFQFSQLRCILPTRGTG